MRNQGTFLLCVDSVHNADEIMAEIVAKGLANILSAPASWSRSARRSEAVRRLLAGLGSDAKHPASAAFGSYAVGRAASARSNIVTGADSRADVDQRRKR